MRATARARLAGDSTRTSSPHASSHQRDGLRQAAEAAGLDELVEHEGPIPDGLVEHARPADAVQQEHARARLAPRARHELERVAAPHQPERLHRVEALVRAWVERPDADRTARERRLKLAWVLREEMRRVVAAADYAFRRHPELRRAARSERTHREREAASRTREERRKAAEGGTTPETPAPTE